MSITRNQATKLLREHSLRCTAPRLAVLGILAEAQTPLSHGEVLQRLGHTNWDPATVYRNLIKLRDAGVAPVVSRANGISRYALASENDDGHRHPHFHCENCGRVACLPADLTLSLSRSLDGAWASSVAGAALQLRGACPDCLPAGSPDD